MSLSSSLSLRAAIHEIMDSACLLSSMKSSIAQAALRVFTSLRVCVIKELPVLFADFHDHIADLFSFARMVREEFIRFCEQHMPRVPDAFHPPSSAEPSPPSSLPRPTNAGKRDRLRRSSRAGRVQDSGPVAGRMKYYCMPMRGNIIEGTLPTASEAQPAQTAAAKVDLALGVRTDGGSVSRRPTGQFA